MIFLFLVKAEKLETVANWKHCVLIKSLENFLYPWFLTHAENVLTDVHAQETVLPAQMYEDENTVRTKDNFDDQREGDNNSNFSDLEL